MKKVIVICAVTLMAGFVLAADPTPKEAVLNAAKQLSDKPNYSWKTTTVVPEGSRFRPGPIEGKTEKDGFTRIHMTFGENSTEAVMKGDNAAVTNQDGEWQSAAELENAEGPGRFLGRMVRNLRTAGAQATELAGFAKDLKKDGDAYASELSKEGAETYLTFRGRGGGGDGPTVANAKGSVKFWLKDGLLAKYEYKVQGTVTFNGNDREVDRTTTVEVKDVGTTKIEIPEAAKKKLGSG